MLRLIRLLSFDSFHSLRSRKRSASKHAQDPRPKGAEAKPIFAMFVRVIIKILLRLPLLSVLLFSQCTKAFYDVLQMSPEGLSPVPMALFVTAENLISTITIQNPVSEMQEGTKVQLLLKIENSHLPTRMYLESEDPALVFQKENGEYSQKLELLADAKEERISLFAVEDANSVNERVVLHFRTSEGTEKEMSVQIWDNDTDIRLSYNLPETLQEGSSCKFRLKLNTEPGEAVKLKFSLSHPESLSLSPEEVEFTKENYSTEKEIQVFAKEDSNSVSENVSIRFSSGEVETLQIVDNDISAVFSVSSLTMSENSTAKLKVRLSSNPASTQTLKLTIQNNLNLGVSPAEIQFTSENWNIEQEISLTAPADSDYLNHSATLVASSASLVSATLPVFVQDADSQNILITGGENVLEGETIQYKVKLNKKPVLPAKVSFTSSNLVKIYPESIYFTAEDYNTEKTLTITAISNDGNETSETVQIQANYEGFATASKDLLIIDKDTKIVFKEVGLPFKEGENSFFRLTLSGNPGIARTITLSDNQEDLALSPVSITFDSTNWETGISITTTQAEDDDFLADAYMISVSNDFLPDISYEGYIQDNDSMLDGSIAYYPFNGNSDDESGNNNHGIPNGATLTTNRYNYKDRAYSFDGVDDYIFVNSTFSELNENLTLSFYFNPKPSQLMFAGIIDKSHAQIVNSNYAYNWVIQKNIDNDEEYYFGYGNIHSYTNIPASQAIPVKLNLWNHIMIVKNGFIVKIYVDGVLLSETLNAISEIAYSELPLYIGTVNGLNRYFNGKIDDIIIFNKALTDSEVLAIYNDTSEVRKNCKAILDDGLAHGDDVYMIDPDGVGGDAPFWAYCDMTTDGGGWTLALKADGNNDTFKYDAVYWENNDLFPANALDITPSLTKEEYKSPAFNTLDYSEIRLVMDTSGDVRELKIPLSQDSLKTMFQGGYIPTNFGRATWKAMVPDSSLQYNCNREGINNVIISSFAYAYSVRLGFITNQENDCGSPDGVIGVGILPGLWNTVYTGNFSSGIFPSDNGVKVLYSFAYVWIR